MKDNIIQVQLWNKDVGLLSWDDKQGCSVFQFDKDFIQYGWNIAPLIAPLDSATKKSFTEVYLNSLPTLCLTIGET